MSAEFYVVFTRKGSGEDGPLSVVTVRRNCDDAHSAAMASCPLLPNYHLIVLKCCVVGGDEVPNTLDDAVTYFHDLIASGYNPRLSPVFTGKRSPSATLSPLHVEDKF